MSQWGMRYEEVTGSDLYLRQLAQTAGDLDSADEEFLVIQPGEELKQSMFVRT